MAKTTLTVLPKKTGPTDALKSMSIANSPKNNAKDMYINTMTSSPSATSPVTKYGSSGLTPQQAANEAAAQAIRFGKGSSSPTPSPVPAPKNQSGPSESLKEMSSALAPKPPTPDYYSKARSAMDEYVKSLIPTDEENKLAKNVSNLRSSISSGVQLASEQAIPMGFITGQQQAIENRGLNAIQPYQDELERLTAMRELESKGLSARQGFETSLADTMAEDARYQDKVAQDERRWAYEVAQDASKPIQVGDRLLQRGPDSTITELYSPPPETPKPFELSEGQSRYEYDPATGGYKLVASKGKTYKPESDSSDSSNRINQLLDGMITLDDVSIDDREKLQDELYKLGFGENTPPVWYSQYYQEENPSGAPLYSQPGKLSQTGQGKDISTSWKEYKTKVLGGKKKGGINFDDL